MPAIGKPGLSPACVGYVGYHNPMDFVVSAASNLAREVFMIDEISGWVEDLLPSWFTQRVALFIILACGLLLVAGL